MGEWVSWGVGELGGWGNASVLALGKWGSGGVREWGQPELSQRLHYHPDEKAFTISGLNGEFLPSGQHLRLQAGTPYRWSITALSNPLVRWLAQWIKSHPLSLSIGGASLNIEQIEQTLPATTYAKLAKTPIGDRPLRLTFTTPTSFRSKGHHLPLPIPRNLFHSYLRRWNDLSGRPPIEADPFLDWVDATVVIAGCHVRSLKVAAGKRGSVTGFVGAIEMGLDRSAHDSPEFVQLFHTLGQFAPYCGTGHKTTFGLGQTRWGWSDADAETLRIDPANYAASQLLAQRIDELTDRFIQQRKRQGGVCRRHGEAKRSQDIAEKWATIVARREIGDSLQAIAQDLELSYETARTYSKRAQRSLRQ